MRIRSRVGASLLFLVCLPAFAASLPVKPPRPEDLDRVRAHEAAVVLLRVAGTIDGKVIAPGRSSDANRLPRMFVASLDSLDAPKRTRTAALTPASADEGWQYLLLPPGTYFLLVLPPGVEQNPPAVAYSVAAGRYGRLTDYALKQGRGGFWSADVGGFVFAQSQPPDFQPLPGFWFEVPHDPGVVYVGSLSTTCKGGRGLFGSLIDSCSDFDLTDESTAAGALAAAALPGLAFGARPLVPYGSLRSAVSPAEPRTVPVAAQGASVVGAAFGGARLEASPTLHGVRPAVSLYNLLVTGGQLLHQSSEAQRARAQAAQLQPCLEGLSSSIAGYDAAAAFASALVAAPGPSRETATAAGVATAAEAASAHRRWSVALPILRLRDAGAPDSLVLELALAVRLENLDTGRLEAYALMVSGPEPPAQDPHSPASPLYMRLVPERAEPRPLDEWCGAGGGALLHAEIERAMKNIAAQLVRDLE